MYEVHIAPRAVQDMTRLPSGYARLVSKPIAGLAEEPRPRGVRKLRDRAYFRLRVDVNRLLYDIDDEKQAVTIYRVLHRREAHL